MNFNITINTDDNYIQHAMAMLCSVFENNKKHTINVHVLMSSLSETNIAHLSSLSKRYNNNCFFYKVDETRLEHVQFRNKRPLSKAAYYRLLLASTLSHLDKVLYLDCDMIVLSDISELFTINLDDYPLAACIDNFPYTNQHRLQLNMDVDERTFCSGIMLVNLHFWRFHDSEKQLLEYANIYRKEVHLHDQDILNFVFKGQWFQIPPKWNRTACSRHQRRLEAFKSFDYMEYTYSPKIIHYASPGIKPWYAGPSPYKSIYAKYLNMSDYTPIKYENHGFKIYINCVIAYITSIVSSYIWPYVPNLIKLLIRDIYSLVYITYILIFKKGKGLKEYLLLKDL